MTKRDYKREYELFQSSESSKDDRVKRNKLRRLFKKLKKVKKGDKKDIDHKDGNPQNNSMVNIRVVSRSINRAKK